MTITPRQLNTNFNDAIYLFLTAIEGSIPFVYADGNGIPTIGVGYALLNGTLGKHNWTLVGDYQAKLLQADPSLTTTQLTTLNDMLTQAMNALNRKIDPSTNQVYINPFKHSDEPNPNVLGWSMADTQIRTLFDNTISTYTDQVKTWLGGAKWAGDSVPIYDRLQGSQEMFALTSLAYNNILSQSPTLKQDVLNGNRAEAWYEIRYNSNGGSSEGRGIAKRRYYESEMFGLYNDPIAPTLDEAKDAYRMLTLHRADIMAYEAKYGLLPDGTRGTSYPASDPRTGLELAQDLGTSVLLLPTQQISTIVESFDPAKLMIMADLGANGNSDVTNAYQTWVVMQGHDPATFNSTDIYFDPGRVLTSQTSSPDFRSVISAWLDPLTGAENSRDSIIIGESSAGSGDYLIGSNGSDLLVGGDGNDTIDGGKGNDVMAGGAGYDTYIIRKGDGLDIIEDKIGDNRIIFDDMALSTFVRNQQGSDFVSLDGAFTAVLTNGNFTVSDKDGNTVTLNQNFQSGDFGITLSDAPTAIQTTYTAVGDPLSTLPP